MDDKLEKAKQDFVKAYSNFVAAVVETAREMGERMREALSEMGELDDALSALSAFIDEAIKKIKKQKEERKKRVRCMSVRMPIFIYDKRVKVYRCRNNC